MIKEIIDAKLNYHKSSGKFGISSIGSCWRKKYMEIKGSYKPQYNSKELRTFVIGDIFHRQACKELLEKAHQFDLNVVAAEVDIPEQKYISGRADVILCNSKTQELFIVDVKSAGDWTLNKIKKGECPLHYANQVQLYLHFFNIKRGYILFIGKHKGEIEEVQVDYNKELCEKLIHEIEDFYKNYVEKDIVPPICDGGQFGCEVCGIKK